ELESANKSSGDARAQSATDAVVNFRKALEICAGKATDADKTTCGPTNQGAIHESIGKALILSGKPQDAAPEYRLAAQSDTVNADKYLYKLGVELFNRSQLDAANQAFKEVIEKNPNNADAYFYKGMTQFSKATIDPKTHQAVYPPDTDKDFKKYLELAPSGPNAAAAQEALKEMQRVATTYKAPKK